MLAGRAEGPDGSGERDMTDRDATDGGGGDHLEGTSWIVEVLDGDPVAIERPPTLAFAEGRIAGHAGVNRFFGPYTLDGDRLIVGPAATTLMAGPPEATAVEQRWLALLARPATVTMTGDTLLIAHDGSSTTTARRAVGEV
jgi:heat shock protein HslJ